MNKFVIFILGAVCGFGVSRAFKDSPTVDVVQESSVERKSHSEVPLIHRAPTVASTPQPSSESPIPDATDVQQAPTPPHPVYFIFSEETVENMEQNIAALQKDVSVVKDREGWIVRFHSTNNLLSQVGISDNDMIRFNQLDEMRLNPDTQDLANRMESVLANLER